MSIEGKIKSLQTQLINLGHEFWCEAVNYAKCDEDGRCECGGILSYDTVLIVKQMQNLGVDYPKFDDRGQPLPFVPRVEKV